LSTLGHKLGVQPTPSFRSDPALRFTPDTQEIAPFADVNVSEGGDV
jgi:hypothetical protein